MKISIRLKPAELISLVAFLEAAINMEECKTRTEAIITTLMVRFYKKLHAKSILVEPHDHRFGIEPEIAMAFIEFFTGIKLNAASHEGNVTQKLISQFDKETSQYY